MLLTKVSYSMIAQTVINAFDYGAAGDGSNATVALQAAATAAAGKSLYIPAGSYLITSPINISSTTTVYGDGVSSVILTNTGDVAFNVTASNCVFRDFQLERPVSGTGIGSIKIGSSCTNTHVNRVYFKRDIYAVVLFATTDVTVSECVFDNTGYGVLQEAGYVSSNVLITNNIAKNMKADFVEANCTNAAPSKNWSIIGNIYEGSENYPTPATEKRFVGVTSVMGVIIADNNVANVAGDSAIHLEDTFGENIITGNVFDNVVCSGGNDGYIYLLNSAKNTLVANNIFLRTDLTIGNAFAMSATSGEYTAQVQFIGNRVSGRGSWNLSGYNATGNSGNLLISDNLFNYCSAAVFHSKTSNVTFSNNVLKNCLYGLQLNQFATSVGGKNFYVSDNVFSNITNYDIYDVVNTNGTSPPGFYTVQGNVFAKQVYLQDIGGVAPNLVNNTVITNNVFLSDATLVGTFRASEKCMVALNIFQVDGYMRSELSNYANDAAAAAAGVPISGMYRNGSVIQVRVV